MDGSRVTSVQAALTQTQRMRPQGGTCPFCQHPFNNFGVYKAHSRGCRSRYAWIKALQLKDLAVGFVVRVRGDKNAARQMALECKSVTPEQRAWVFRHIQAMPTEGLWR